MSKYIIFKIEINGGEDIYNYILNISQKYCAAGVLEVDMDEERVDSLFAEKAYISSEIDDDIINCINHISDHLKVYFEIKDNENNWNNSELSHLFEEDLKLHTDCKYSTYIENQSDWNNEWKKHYKPIDLEGQLMIYPSWFKSDIIKNEKNKTNEKKIFIHPGMGFGTGTHETTALCLKAFFELQNSLNFDCSECLDLGCGSGILGIVLSKYFNTYLTYCDIDRDALDNTLQNIELNNLDTQKLEIVHRFDLSQKEYNIVFANILLSELIKEKLFIVSSLKANSYLFLSGILIDQVDELKDHFNMSNLEFVKTFSKNEWACVIYHCQKSDL